MFQPSLQIRELDRANSSQSERVTFSNLRETVLSLADPTTNPQIREAFYAHNPIPGAIWRLENGTHVLENPYSGPTHQCSPLCATGPSSCPPEGLRLLTYLTTLVLGPSTLQRPIQQQPQIISYTTTVPDHPDYTPLLVHPVSRPLCPLNLILLREGIMWEPPMEKPLFPKFLSCGGFPWEAPT
jgi:hypothetical protein